MWTSKPSTVSGLVMLLKYWMVTQKLLRARKKKVISEKKYSICDYSRSNPIPKTDQNHILLLKCATISELPSNISTMGLKGLVYAYGTP